MSGSRLYTGLALLMLLAGYAGFLAHDYYRAHAPDHTPQPPALVQIADPAVLDQTQIEALRGTPGSEFSLPDISGVPRHLKEWEGRVCVLNFWATWCAPCLREIPGLIALQQRHGEAGLQVIGIALQAPEEVVGFIHEYGMNYPVLTGEMEAIEIAESYGNSAGVVPYTVMLDRSGAIQFLKHGELEMVAFEAEIKRLLE